MGDTYYIAVIDPAARVAETDCHNRIAQQSPVACCYYLPALQGDKLPPVDQRLRGIIIFGSGASVHDSLDWQNHLKEWLSTTIAANIPTLGICYGHQLIAHMLGGTVEFLHSDQTKRVGVRPISFFAAPLPWLSPKTYPLVVSHRETVTVPPPDFTVVAKSDEIAIEALKHNSKPIYTVQSHPEATLTFLRNQSIPEPENSDWYGHGFAIVDEFIRKVALDS